MKEHKVFGPIDTEHPGIETSLNPASIIFMSMKVRDERNNFIFIHSIN